MGITSLLLLTLATSMDGLWSGLAVGMQRRRFGCRGLGLIALVTVAGSALALQLGRSLLFVLDGGAARIIGGGIMIAVGGWLLREGLLQKRLLGVGSQAPRVQTQPASNGRWSALWTRLTDPFGAGSHDPEIGQREAVALSLAVAADTSVLAMAAGIAGYHPLATPILFGTAHLVMVCLGNSLGRHRRLLAGTQQLSALPGLILMAVGVARLLG